MTPANRDQLLLILDDREIAGEDIRRMVGERRFGDIVLRRRTLAEHFRDALPAWAQPRLRHLRTAEDVAKLRAELEGSGRDAAAFVCAARAGFAEAERLGQLVERLPYADQDFTDRLYKPLVVFMRNAHALIDAWPQFAAAPLHLRENPWTGSLRVESVQPLDLGRLRDFLTLAAGSTAARHFNAVSMDTYFYTKSSSDKRKMRAEYSFYGLVPEALRPWLVQPFDFRDEGERASYRMMRYYHADAALQWVHDAFDAESFAAFADRLLFFVAQRPRKPCPRGEGAALARELFVAKVQSRLATLLQMPEGRRIDQLLASAEQGLALERQLARYLRLFERHQKGFATDHVAVGHGDPCFSNILYDQQRHLLQLVDPKGALDESELWTHPLYDVCKISHSVLGDYDFINGGLYTVDLSSRNELQLRIAHGRQPQLKPLFTARLKALGHDPRVVRLGEASLFLSMLPLHMDHPNKVLAFALAAARILDEVDHE